MRTIAALIAVCAASLLVWLLSAAAVADGAPSPPLSERPRDNWQFKFDQFVIGAWWGPDATDAEIKAYAECGFNVVMGGRYMELDRYGDPEAAQRELDLAARYGLGMMFDTYTMNDRPWGGSEGPFDEHPTHHPANLTELKWLYQRIGKHPALVGFMIGDDQGAVSERARDCTQFLFEQGPPHLMPWLCGWISPENLAASNNPFEDPQIYPTLYQWDLPAEGHTQAYAAAYWGFSRGCQANGVIFWPMFNVSAWVAPDRHDQWACCPSDSLVRFPAYAALAYGAEGIWYFCYNGSSIQNQGPHQTDEEVRAALSPLYPVAQRINHRIAAWGPMLLGRTSTGLFGTAFDLGKSAPSPSPTEQTQGPTAEGLTAPSEGKLIAGMDDDLIVGILTKAGEAPLAMVVNCSASKGFDDVEPRTVSITFSDAVRRAIVHELGATTETRGSTIRLTLDAGEGQLLELRGYGLDALCATEAIYAEAGAENR